MKENKIERIKQQILKSEANFSQYAAKSSDAIRLQEEEKDIRLEYERDIDRIIHSHSYTRYIDKTQVYSHLQNDNISRRITHVQFVSRAARTIARALGLNEDLCEAISLGHDVGHVPFGHFGESILNEISLRRTGLCFAHNLNSVRVFKDIEKRGHGSNLTLQVLDGIMCHNGEMVKSKYTPRKKDVEEVLREYEACRKDAKQIAKLIPMTMEGCVVRISDIIGYIGKDIDDARKLDVFDIDTIPKSVRTTLGITNDEIMHNIIMDVVTESYDKPYIQMSDRVYEQVQKLKSFNYENIYDKAMESKEKNNVRNMFEKLYDMYVIALEKEDKSNSVYTVFLKNMSLPYLQNASNDEKVIDFIASMTDNYLQRQFEQYI
ncbi:MAG: HD domain-containing protein [Clostridia bacterium]|nr:HD domain-containing protein [Clostridia bacterium]